MQTPIFCDELSIFGDGTEEHPLNTGSALQQTAKITITAAQIKQLNTTPIVIIPAPGAGKAIVPQGGVMTYKAGATPYTLNGATFFNIGIDAVGNFGLFFSTAGFVDQAASQILQGFIDGGIEALSNVANTAMSLTNDVANLTAGDGTLILEMFYQIVDVS